LEFLFELQFEFELLELFELVFELLFELELELLFELLFELVLELELLDEFDELFPKNANLSALSVTSGACSGAFRVGKTGAACAAPAPRMPAAMIVAAYFMTARSFWGACSRFPATHLIDCGPPL
jgi:hypothetical protein